MDTIQIEPLGWLEKLGDSGMIPLMYLLAGTLREAPQETHRWNNQKLRLEEVAHLKTDQMVFCPRDRFAIKRLHGLDVRFHMPILGGWNHYIVVTPNNPDEATSGWYVGWTCPMESAVSRIPLRGSVRLLRCPVDAMIYGIDSTGRQISIKQIGKGRLGRRGPFSDTKLL